MFIFGHLSVFGYLVICIFERYFVYLSVYSLGGFVVLENVLEDNELGRFLIKVNTRARRLTFRTREDAIYVTIPPGTTLKEIKNAIEELRPRLRVARKKYTRPLIDLNFRIDTEFFKLSLVSGQRERFLSRSELGVYAFTETQSALPKCKNQFQQWTLGELFGTAHNQPVLLSGFVAETSDRLCTSARIVSYS